MSAPARLPDLATMAAAQCREQVVRARQGIDEAQDEMRELLTPLVTNGLRTSVEEILASLETMDERLQKLLPMIERHFSGRDDG